MSNLLSLTSKQLKKAAALKDKIADLEKQFYSLLSEWPSDKQKKTKRYKRGPMSAAAKKKIAAAAKARWAKAKAAGKSRL